MINKINALKNLWKTLLLTATIYTSQWLFNNLSAQESDQDQFEQVDTLKNDYGLENFIYYDNWKWEDMIRESLERRIKEDKEMWDNRFQKILDIYPKIYQDETLNEDLKFAILSALSGWLTKTALRRYLKDILFSSQYNANKYNQYVQEFNWISIKKNEVKEENKIDDKSNESEFSGWLQIMLDYSNEAQKNEIYSLMQECKDENDEELELFSKTEDLIDKVYQDQNLDDSSKFKISMSILKLGVLTSKNPAEAINEAFYVYYIIKTSKLTKDQKDKMLKDLKKNIISKKNEIIMWQNQMIMLIEERENQPDF